VFAPADGRRGFIHPAGMFKMRRSGRPRRSIAGFR
jgi:hypothetical protein